MGHFVQGFVDGLRGTCVALTTLMIVSGAQLVTAEDFDLTVPNAVPFWKQKGRCDPRELSPQGISCITVELDPKLLSSPQAQRLTLILPDGRSIVASKVETTTLGKTAFIWRGEVEGEAMSSVTFSVVKESIVGNVRTSPAKVYRLRRTSNNERIIEQLDVTKFPPEGKPLPRTLQPGSSASGASPCTDDPNRIDVMVVYTARANCAVRGEPYSGTAPCAAVNANADDMLALVYQAVSDANWSYTQSDISQQIEPVFIGRVEYTENGISNDLTSLWNGSIPNVQHWRDDTYHADAVVLITEDTSASGSSRGWMPGGDDSYAFSVVPQLSATSILKFAHELGHTMGAYHDTCSAHMASGAFAYSYGHVKKTPLSGGCSNGTTAGPWMTIMGQNDDIDTNCCQNCAPIWYWSRPNSPTPYCGSDTGIAGQEDNRATLNATAQIVANYRCSNSPRPKNVWMKDAWQDTGAEPDPSLASEPMWESPYIWVRNQRDPGPTTSPPSPGFAFQHRHQNPLFGQTNYIYVKLHNGGPASSGTLDHPQTLEIYVAKAATGLSWPSSWQRVQAKPVPMFAANSTMILEIPWTPTDKGHYCLLARWNSPSDPMTTPETTNVDANVRGNNNIVWRNVNIIDLTDALTEEATFIVRNPDPDKPATIGLVIRARPTPGGDTFLSFGKISVLGDAKFTSAWKEGGYKGDGFTRDGDTIMLSSTKIALDGIFVPPKFEASVKISFARGPKFVQGTFYVDVIQVTTEGDRRIGGIGGITYQIYTSEADKDAPGPNPYRGQPR